MYTPQMNNEKRAAMTLTYIYENSIYVNLTNRCTCACEFCLRNKDGGKLYTENSLWLEHDPDRADVLDDILKRSPAEYREVVFCGYGEPTCRLDDMLWICAGLKRSNSQVKIRLNTNGHASIISGPDTPPKFKGLIDVMSISMNAADDATYRALCHPKFAGAYAEVLKFARDCTDYVPTVVMTAVRGTIPDGDLDRCAVIADELGVKFRIRDLI